MVNVIVSGYFNPFHLYHKAYIDGAIQVGIEEKRWLFEKVQLWIIVNSDEQVKLKGSCPFFNQDERYAMMKYLYPKAKVRISGSCERDICWDLRGIQIQTEQDNLFNKVIFCNGGDINFENASCKEMTQCAESGILVRFGVGGSYKGNSSSKLIKNAVDWWMQSDKATPEMKAMLTTIPKQIL